MNVCYGGKGMTRNAIFVNKLTCSFEDKLVLNDISFVVPSNSTCVIIGPSGCGKTTLLHTLAGFVKPISGELRMNDVPVTDFPKQTGMILQEYALLPWCTVFDNVAIGLKIAHHNPERIKEKTNQVLRELGILSLGQRYPSQISGGQKQRVAIARSLSLNPEILLLDEATSALDAMTKEQLQDMLLSIHQTKKTTLLQVTHSIEEAVFLGEQIIVMNQGGIHDIIQNPLFGIENSRKKTAFYDMCLMVRGSLESGTQHE